MKLTKIQAYFFFISVLLTICLLYQAVWLISGKTTGIIMDFDSGAGDYRHVENVTVSYSVDHKVYTDIYLRNELDAGAKTVPVKYLLFAPSISRLDNPVGNWGLVLVVFVIVFFCLSISFLIQVIIPNGSIFIVSRTFPFVRMKKPAGFPDPNDQYAW